MYKDLENFKEALFQKYWANRKMYWIPKNGMILALMMQDKFLVITDADLIDNETIIIDDIIDTGKTFNNFDVWIKVALYGKSYSPKIDYTHIVKEWWIDIPFEVEKPIEDHFIRILQYIWEDPTREWLVDTPRRVIKSYNQIFGGYKQKAEDVMTVFSNEQTKIDQIIGLSDIEYYSTCEHHMIPFFGKAHIYYIPWDKICGISKLARLLDIHSRRLQNQERIAKSVADDIERLLQPKWVAVVIEGRHLCMMARGVWKQGSVMKTSELRWFFKDKIETRQELFNLIK